MEEKNGQVVKQEAKQKETKEETKKEEALTAKKDKPDEVKKGAPGQEPQKVEAKESKESPKEKKKKKINQMTLAEVEQKLKEARKTMGGDESARYIRQLLRRKELLTE